MFQSTCCIVARIPVFQGVTKSEIHWFVFHSLCAAEHRFNTYYPDDFWQRAAWKSFSRINYSPQYLCGQHLVNWPFYTTAHGQLLWKVPEVKYSNGAQNENCGFFVRSPLYPDFLWSFHLIDVCMSWLSTVFSHISSLSPFCLGTQIIPCHECSSISGITLDKQLGTSKLCLLAWCVAYWRLGQDCALILDALAEVVVSGSYAFVSNAVPRMNLCIWVWKHIRTMVFLVEWVQSNSRGKEYAGISCFCASFSSVASLCCWVLPRSICSWQFGNWPGWRS